MMLACRLLQNYLSASAIILLVNRLNRVMYVVIRDNGFKLATLYIYTLVDVVVNSSKPCFAFDAWDSLPFEVVS